MSERAFERVLVPVELEGDEGGEASATVEALALASRLARGGELCLVHATPDFRDYVTWMSPSRVEKLQRDASSYAAKMLVGIAERHCTHVALRYVVAAGKPLDVILGAARERAVDAIVIAASARGRVNRAFLGSTADKVIRHASCPVVVVPSERTA